MANKSDRTAPSILAWFNKPTPQYIPLADIQFGPSGIVMPHALPPTGMVFPNASFNKMLNIPSAQAVYDTGRTGRIF